MNQQRTQDKNRERICIFALFLLQSNNSINIACNGNETQDDKHIYKMFSFFFRMRFFCIYTQRHMVVQSERALS